MCPFVALLLLILIATPAVGVEPNSTANSDDEVASQCILEQSVLLTDLNNRWGLPGPSSGPALHSISLVIFFNMDNP